MSSRHVKQKFFNAAQTGVNGDALDSAHTGSSMDWLGYNQACVEIKYVYGAGTSLSMYLEVSHDGTDWSRLQGGSLSSGVTTVSDLSYKKVGTADAKWAVNFPINYKFVRLVFSCAGTPTTSDLVTAVVRLGIV